VTAGRLATIIENVKLCDGRSASRTFGSLGDDVSACAVTVARPEL
jgi:hypothetical protein